MHSHDRTLLAKLGFQDPDRRDPIHDLACRYLCEPERARRVHDKFIGPNCMGEGGGWLRSLVFKLETCSANQEVAISKGVNQYRTTIGFVDAVIGGRYRSTESEDYSGDCILETRVAIEVKIHPVTASELLRQLNLYREYDSPSGAVLQEGHRLDPSGRVWTYAGRTQWVAAVRFDITSGFINSLRGEGVEVVRLGRSFDEWLETSKRNDVPGNAEEV